MKKTQLIIPSILSIMSFILSSGQASMIEEHVNDLTPQQPLKNIEDEQPSIVSKKVMNNHAFNEAICYRMIAEGNRELELISLGILKQDASIVNFDLAKKVYDFAQSCTDINEKAIFCEIAKIHFDNSKHPQAKNYLDEIAAFMNGNGN